MSPRYEKIKTAWTEASHSEKVQTYSAPNFLTKVLLVAFIFFIGAVLVAGFIIFRGSNVVSNTNIDLVINGPATAKAGEDVNFQIVVANGNSVPLEEAELIVRYPEDARLPNSELPADNRVRNDIGTVRPGETVNKTAEVILFGQENSTKEILVTLEYRIPGSNAFYEKTESVEIVINSPPISISIETLPEVVAGSESEIEIVAVSNAETDLEDILLSVSYPFGFKFNGSNEEPDYGDSVWSLGTMEPGEKKTIIVRGIMDGQDRELKTFTFSVGRAGRLATGRIADVFSEQIQTISIKRPFINASLTVNGKTLSESVTESGGLVRVDIDWINNLATPVVDVELVATLEGAILDEGRVSAGEGFYRSTDNSIVWNKSRLPALAELSPGSGGETSFSFYVDSLTSGNGQNVRNPSVDIDLTIKGVRVSSGFRGESVESSTSHRLKVESELQLASRVIRTIGPFENSGPMPPKVGEETTYTVVWSISNSSNLVRNATVRTVLPPSIRWAGLVRPSTERVTYNESTGELIWQIDQIEPGVGSASGVRELFFHIGFTPSANQVGDVPNLTSEIQLVGQDDFTGTTLSDTNRPLNTRLSTDPGFNPRDASVVE